MRNETVPKPCRTAGRLLMAFGTAELIASIAGAVLLDSLIVDVVAIVVILLGSSVARGSARAAWWSRILMVYYTAVATMLIVSGSIRPSTVRVGNRGLEQLGQQGRLAVFVLVSLGAVWALTNFVLLWRYRHLFAKLSQLRTGPSAHH